MHALHYANELLVCVSFPFKNFCKLAQHAEAIRKHCLGKEQLSVPIVQTTKPHFDLFLSGMNVTENFLFFRARVQKGIDALMRAVWYELLHVSTMANCGKIVTFLCLGISIIT